MKVDRQKEERKEELKGGGKKDDVHIFLNIFLILKMVSTSVRVWSPQRKKFNNNSTALQNFNSIAVTYSISSIDRVVCRKYWNMLKPRSVFHSAPTVLQITIN